MKWARAAPALILLLAYLGLTIVFTYPLAWHFTTHHVGEDGGDARVYLWNYWWVDRAVRELHTDPFETDYIFYPLGIGLSLHTLGFLQGLAFIASKALFGSVAGANVVLLWTFLASALATYGLARYWGASRYGAFVAGAIFAFCPYRLARLAGHYDLLGTEWLPLYTLTALMTLRHKGSRHALLAGGLAAACGYTTLTYLAFAALWSMLLVGVELARGRNAHRVLARFVTISLTASVLLAPLLHGLASDLSRWDYPPYLGSNRYSANVAAYVLPGPRQNLLGPLLGRSFDPNLTETTVYAGYFTLLLAGAAGLHPRVRAAHRLWLGAAGVFFCLSLGSALQIGAWRTGLPLPFAAIEHLPLLHHLRAPSRFCVLVMLSLAVLASGTWSAWLERFRRPAAKIALTCGATAFIAADTLAVPIPLFKAGVAPIYELIAADPTPGTAVEIPGIEQVPGRLMYHQIAHHKKIFIGTAARVPRAKFDYYFGLHLIRPLVDLRKAKIRLSSALVERERRFAGTVARFLEIRYFVIHRSYAKRGVVDFLEQVLPLERMAEQDERILLRVRREALPALPRLIEAGAEGSRLYFATGWSRPEAEGPTRFRWANARESTLLLRRPSPPARRLVMRLAPLEGRAQEVEAWLGKKRLGTTRLSPGWSEIAWTLPPRANGVERLVLRWSVLENASPPDPRRLAARVASVRFE